MNHSFNVPQCPRLTDLVDIFDEQLSNSKGNQYLVNIMIKVCLLT